MRIIIQSGLPMILSTYTLYIMRRCRLSKCTDGMRQAQFRRPHYRIYHFIALTTLVTVTVNKSYLYIYKISFGVDAFRLMYLYDNLYKIRIIYIILFIFFFISINTFLKY